MLRLFISHSSKNAWVVDKFEDLVRTIVPDTHIFASSDAVIDPGKDYVDVIYKNIVDGDVFVAFISREYWASKFCIFELGAAYQLYRERDSNISIQPLLMPPLNKGNALSNTPIVQMQLTDLTDPGAISLLFRKLLGPDDERLVDRHEVEIAEFATFVKRGVLSQASLLSDARVDVFFDERGDIGVPRDQIVRCTSVGDGAYLFEFTLSRLPYTPGFASLACMFDNHVNLSEYLSFDRGATFCFTIDNLDGVLKGIAVEFKHNYLKMVHRSIAVELVEGKQDISIPLADMNYDPLKDISEICFVINPGIWKELDGSVVISDIRVDFGEESILDNPSID